jgi:type IV pilus assembly protein PilM
VDVEAFAMYRSLVETNVGPYNEETIALVDVGAQTTNVSVVSCGIFGMTRSINQGGQLLTDALKSHFKLEDAEAELGKSQLDLRALIAEQKAQESPPLRVLQPHLDDLIREIRRSLNYYQSQQTEHGTPTPVTRVLLAGGGANLPGLAEYMAHKLGLTVDRHGIYDAEVVHAPADNQSTGIELAVVGGLAMRPHVRAT